MTTCFEPLSANVTVANILLTQLVGHILSLGACFTRFPLVTSILALVLVVCCVLTCTLETILYDWNFNHFIGMG